VVDAQTWLAFSLLKTLVGFTGENNVRLSKAVLTISVLLIAVVAEAQVPVARKTACAETLPAGLVIRVEPDEKIVAGETDGPLLLTVTSDIRLFPGKPPIVPRSSKLLAKTIESKEAGHLWGKARYQLAIETILTPNECEYSMDAKLVQAGKYKVEKAVVIGKGHAGRDLVLFVFPPTTLYQLIRLPARGPKLILDEESILAVRLMQPVHLQLPEISEGNLMPASSVQAAGISPGGCSELQQPDLHNPLLVKDGIMRPLRNMTPYQVTLAIGKDTLANLGPCFGSMVRIPEGEFTITAQAAVLDTGRQREVPMEIVVNATGTGWDVINKERSADSATVATRLQPR
jgi:hypothetical protein